MSTIVSESDYNAVFDDAVTEFRLKQRGILQGFLTGCVELGEILQRHRDEMKRLNKWMDYCREVDITVTQANQYIRLYEYSLECTSKQLLGKVITNWAKANLFLSLKEEEKEAVLKIEEGTEDISSSEEFREMVADVKHLGGDVDVDEASDSALWQNFVEFTEDVESNPILKDEKSGARMLQRAVKFSEVSMPYFEAIINLKKSLAVLAKATK